MKRFDFPLSRVLEWRRTQARIEEAKLERAYAAVGRVERQIEQARAEQSRAEEALLAAGSTTGAELAAFASFKKSVAAECVRLEQAAQAARQRAAVQMEAVTKARREVRLLEKLEQREQTAWDAAYAREIEAQVEEAHRAKLMARQP
jgi:flagellar export protein FliJ